MKTHREKEKRKKTHAGFDLQGNMLPPLKSTPKLQLLGRHHMALNSACRCTRVSKASQLSSYDSLFNKDLYKKPMGDWKLDQRWGEKTILLYWFQNGTNKDK